MTGAGVEVAQIPPGAIARLTAHYGPSVAGWLAAVGSIVDQAAATWGVTLAGFHDRGWASVVAHGVRDDGQQVVIKAIPERDRYLRERATLRHWQGRSVPRLLASDDLSQQLLMETIGRQPGGSARPHDHESRVAHRLPALHQPKTPALAHVPHVSTTLQAQTLPELRRSASLKARLGASAISRIVAIGEQLDMDDRRTGILHGDLYAENVVFDADGEPRFIDPRGMIGPGEYDWAFWCVFYLNDGFERRLSIVDESRLANTDLVLRWSAVLAASRIRYQLDAGLDEGLTALEAVLVAPALQHVLGGTS